MHKKPPASRQRCLVLEHNGVTVTVDLDDPEMKPCFRADDVETLETHRDASEMIMRNLLRARRAAEGLV